MKQVLHSICIPKKELKTSGGGQPCLGWEGSKFYDFNEQIFTRQFSWQKFIEIYQILSYDLVCQFALLGGKGLMADKSIETLCSKIPFSNIL